jgi:hypothetical protein
MGLLSLCNMCGCDLTFVFPHFTSRDLRRDRFRQFPEASRFDALWAVAECGSVAYDPKALNPCAVIASGSVQENSDKDSTTIWCRYRAGARRPVRVGRFSSTELRRLVRSTSALSTDARSRISGNASSSRFSNSGRLASSVVFATSFGFCIRPLPDWRTPCNGVIKNPQDLATSVFSSYRRKVRRIHLLSAPSV